MKKSSIKTAILLPVLCVLVAGVVAMVVAVGAVATSTANDITERLVDARVAEYTNAFNAETVETYTALKAITPTVTNYVDPAFAADADNPRGDVVDILRDTLAQNSKMVGIWCAFEPNAFDGKDADYVGAEAHDDTGRFVPYVYKDGAGVGMEPLVAYDDPVDGDFYQGVVATGDTYITDPYEYVVGGQSVVIFSIAFPVRTPSGEMVGAVGADFSLQSISDVISEGSILDDGYLFLLSPSGLFAAHNSSDLLLKSYSTTWMNGYKADIDSIFAMGGSFSGTAYADTVGADVRFLMQSATIGDTNDHWIVGGVVPESSVSASATSIVTVVVLIGLALILVVGLVTFLIVRTRLKDLPLMTGVAEMMAEGNVQMDTTAVDMTTPTKNEIELLSRAFVHMADGVQLQADTLAHIAEGDYSVSIPVRGEADVMNQAINNLLDSTNTMLSEVREASGQVAGGASQIADGAQSLATGSTQQAATLQEFSATISTVQAQAEQSAQLANNTHTETGRAGELMGESMASMGQMTDAMGTIEQSSQEIAKVIKVIDDIAFQTNILALNAAVEAARAGQHGKGFAVVADEVRNLASKSAAAAKETAGLIANSVENVAKGTEIARNTAESLTQVGEIAQKNAEDMEALSALSQQQSAAITEINQGIGQISSVVQANSATAEESAASAEEMNAQSALLEEIVGRFRLRDTPPALGQGAQLRLPGGYGE